MDDPEDTEGTGPAAEMDSDHEENWNWGGGGDFVLDETPRASALRTRRRRRRLMRQRHRLRLRLRSEICSEAPGSKGGDVGVRMETEGARIPGIFTMCQYHWLLLLLLCCRAQSVPGPVWCFVLVSLK
mmetsp:Transcript_1253/g.3981  ORF Transcript_1253/g.3981 Transcript_1253/m.3981 type:complete len:128 (+) Transcript_1253:435-818(+)